MPLFEFHCRRCDTRFEKLVRASDGGPPPCPQCGAREVGRAGVSLTAAPGKSRAIIASARRQAAREGHFSHYSASESPRL